MMLSQHSQMSQYQGLIRAHGGTFSAEENQALNLTTNPQQYHHQQRPHQHQQLQQQQQQQQQQNYAMVMSVQDLQSRPVQRVSPAVQPADSNMSSHDIPDDILLKPPEGGRRGSGDVTTIEVPLSRYSSVLASALPTVTSDGNALQIKRKDFIASRKKREFIPDQAKDNCYWDKRKKNNEAAKRSREKRRLNDIVLEARVLDLTQENDALREKLDVFAERFGIDDIDSVSIEDLRDFNLRDSPLVTIKQEAPSSPPPSHTEVVAKDLANECIIVENSLHQRSADDHQRQTSQYCHNQANQLSSVSMTMQRATALAQESNSANSHHQSNVQCASKVPVVSAASSCPVGIHVPSQYQLNSQSHRYLPSEMISALIIKDGPTRSQSATTTSNDHVPDREVNRATSAHGNPNLNHRSVPTALAKLYGIEQRPASSVAAEQLPKRCDYSDTVLPHNTKKSNSMPSLVDVTQDGQWYSPDTRERKISQCSDDSALGDKSPSHSVFAGAETMHKLPHKLRCKPGRSATPPDSFPHESSSNPSSPRALVIDVSNHQASDFSRAVEISGICTPPSSIEQSGDDSLPSSPVSLTSAPEELAKQCSHPIAHTGAKPTIEPYRKMVLAAQKLAMVSSDTDSTPESSKRVHCADNEEQQYWAKRRRNNEQTVHGLPVTQHQATQQGQVPQRSSYLEFENSQLRNELKMLSQDVASLKNLIHSK